MMIKAETKSVLKLRGLPWSCTTEDIIKFMEGVKISFKENEPGRFAIYLMTNSEGRPSGEAFIKVEADEDVEAACNKNNALMGQRYIEVFRSNQEQLDKHLNQSTNNSQNWRDPVVRLRGLPYGCEKKDIVAFFEGLNTSEEKIMMVIDFSGRFNGEAFVQFGQREDAVKALDKHKQKIANRYIEVFRSTSGEMHHYQNDSNQGPSSLMSMPSRGGSRGGYDRRNDRAKPYSRGYDNGGYNNRRDNDYGGNYGNNGYNNRGRGGNNYNSNYNDYNDNYGDYDGYNDGNSPYGNNYGNNYNDNYDDGPMHGVKMRGLPFQATESDISEFFAPVKPTNINILKGRDYRPTGEGEVDFATHGEALRAMEKDKKYMGKRYVELFLLSEPGNDQSQAGSLTPPETSLSLGSLMNKKFNSLSHQGQGNQYQNYDQYNTIKSDMNGPGGALPPADTSSTYSTNINELLMAEMAQKMFATAYGHFQQAQNSQGPSHQGGGGNANGGGYQQGRFYKN